MDAAVKKIGMILVVVFVGFYLVKDPTGLANFTKDGGTAIWNVLVSLFNTLIEFLNALFA